MPKKYVLCRPRGGLNDTFCQIEKCWRYASEYGRVLILDTRNSGLLVDFSTLFYLREVQNPSLFSFIRSSRNGLGTALKDFRYLKLRPPQVFSAMDCVDWKNLESLPTLPSQLSGRLTTYSVEFKGLNFVDRDSGVQLSFDLKSDHHQEILVHEQSGGGSKSVNFLNRVRFKPEIKMEINNRLKALGDDYLGVHIRNTDHRSNYEEFLRGLAPRLAGKRVLLCSDSKKVIDFSRDFLRASEVMTLRKYLPEDDEPLHLQKDGYDPTTKVKITIDALCDLMGLARSKKLYFPNLVVGFPSGFSRLANNLNKNPALVETLLNS